jgi:hypothetical protein
MQDNDEMMFQMLHAQDISEASSCLALGAAVRCQSSRVLDMLLQKCPHQEALDACFVQASSVGNVHAMRKLYNEEAQWHFRALVVAVDNGKEEAVRFLLSRLSVDAVSRKRPEVLHRAVEKDFPDIVQMLLDFGVDPAINRGAALRKANGNREMLTLLSRASNRMRAQTPP